MFIGFIAHELFHNWNVFSVNWTGKLYNWFEEGGANFMANLACEELFGEEFAAGGRAYFAAAYDGSQGPRGYESTETLETVQKSEAGSPDLVPIYYYGALVWEQLRRKVGDDALLAGLGDFFREYQFKKATFEDLLRCLESKTTVKVEAYLKPWITNNARIDMAIGKVSVYPIEEGYRTDVEFVVEADRDYELFTS